MKVWNFNLKKREREREREREERTNYPLYNKLNHFQPKQMWMNAMNSWEKKRTLQKGERPTVAGKFELAKESWNSAGGNNFRHCQIFWRVLISRWIFAWNVADGSTRVDSTAKAWPFPGQRPTWKNVSKTTRGNISQGTIEIYTNSSTRKNTTDFFFFFFEIIREELSNILLKLRIGKNLHSTK